MRSGCRLFVDASGLVTRVGLWEDGRWLAYREEETPALEALFASIRAVLAEAQTSLAQAAGFIYVEGPGSVLGLRLAAMAIRTWQVESPRPVWSCGSLHLAATLALAAGTKPPFSICAEARQGLWNVLTLPEGSGADIATLEIAQTGADKLPQGELFYLSARKSWASPPPHARPLSASVRDHPEALNFPGLCRPTETAVPYGTTPTYRKWTPTSVSS